MSKRGLEPLRPFERQPLKLVRLPFRHSDVVFLKSIFNFLREKQTQCHNRKHPHECEHGGDAVEVALCCGTTQCSRTPTTKHVAEPAAATAMEQHSNDHGEHGNHVDNDGDDFDELSHGLNPTVVTLENGRPKVVLSGAQPIAARNLRTIQWPSNNAF